MFATLVRAAAWLSLLGIIVLSVVPVGLRPHVMDDKHHEHFSAYFLCGCCLAVGYPKLRLVLASGLMLTVLPAILEIVQEWVPGRTPSMGDWLSSACGAWCGLALIWLASRAFGRMSAVLQSE